MGGCAPANASRPLFGVVVAFSLYIYTDCPVTCLHQIGYIALASRVYMPFAFVPYPLPIVCGGWLLQSLNVTDFEPAMDCLLFVVDDVPSDWATPCNVTCGLRK